MHLYTTAAIFAGIILDFIVGDPQSITHPVVYIGKMISFLEKKLRVIFPDTIKGRRMAGGFMWLLVIIITGAVPACILYAAWHVHPLVYCAISAVMCCQIMATKSLKDESMPVYSALIDKNIEKARYQVSRIVGRDTDRLDEAGVVRAAVETVAENTSDGSIAPLFYMMIGGPVLGFIYKAVNTMDSMVGYKNEKYIDFGKAAAGMDDLWNFIPSRLAAVLMVCASYLTGLDGSNAWKIFIRDRKKSPSPNSAQTESVCAGALGVTLLGDCTYFGKLHHKEVIGDAYREIEAQDIRRANRLLYVTVLLAVLLLGGLRLCFVIYPFSRL